MTSLLTVPAQPHVFGICYVAAFAVTWVMLLGEGRRRGWPADRWLLLVAWTSLFAAAGSKLAMLTPGDWHAAFGRGLIPTTGMKSFLGMVVAGAAGAEIGRRLLGLRPAIADAYALTMPAGLAVARIGCLLNGCCFGTPASLPWAIRYPAGSLAHAVHSARGLIPAGAEASLPVHPVQAYEILALAGVVGVLLWARPRLKRELSLFLLCIALQSLVRVGVEFLRDGRPVPRFLGMAPLQSVLLLVALGSATGLWLRERHVTPETSSTLKSLPSRLAFVAVGTGLGLLLFGAWFTPLEIGVLFARCLPAIFLAALAVARESIPVLRWTTTAVLAGTMLVPRVGAELGETGDPLGHRTYYNVSVGGALGEYRVESCGEYYYYDYREAGIGLSRADDIDGYGRAEYGLALAAERTTGHHSSASQTARLFAGFDNRWAGISVGALGGRFVRDSVEELDWFYLPAGRLRLGPEDVAYAEFSLAEEPAGIEPIFRIGLGFGCVERNIVSLRIGLTGLGRTELKGPAVYINPSFVLARQLAISPMVALAGDESYHLGLSLRYSFGAGFGQR